MVGPEDSAGVFDFLAKYVWYALIALFFGMVRAIVRQEYKTPLILLAATVISFGCAMFTAFVMSELKYPQWAVYSGVAMSALISNDVVKIILNFAELAARDKGYLGRITGSVIKTAIPQPVPEDKKEDGK